MVDDMGAQPCQSQSRGGSSECQVGEACRGLWRVMLHLGHDSQKQSSA